MNCRRFRENYSEFADGLLDEQAEIEARRHLAECACCRRFDAVYQAGLSALQALPPLAVSRGFARRLTERLRRDCYPEPVLRQWSGVAGAVLVLAAVTLFSHGASSRTEARRTRAAISADSLDVGVPGMRTDPAPGFAEPFGNPFDPFPPASNIISPQTLPSRLSQYAVLASY